MKRAVPTPLLGLPVAIAIALAAVPAYADCAADIRAVRTEAAGLKDDSRKQELQKLLEKAEKDDRAGRASACDKTVQQARQLLK
jgi:hypothetical protein